MCNVCTREVAPAPEPATVKHNKAIERLKMKHNITTDPTDEKKQKEVEYQPDLLALSTQFSKMAYDIFKQSVVRLQETKAYAWVFQVKLIFLERCDRMDWYARLT